MRGNEIRKRIDDNNAAIEHLMQPGNFNLQTVVRDYINDNRKLQNECEHFFIDGICKYCDFQNPKYDFGDY